MNYFRQRVVVIVFLILPATVFAQRAPLIEGPAETRPELPSFQPPEKAPGAILPPIPLPVEPDVEGLSGGLRVFIRDVRITGGTVIPQEELDTITEPYEGKVLSFSDLENLRDQLTRAYINRGYISSGAVIPDQTIDNGIVELRIVEGVLGDVVVQTDGRLKDSYIRSCLLRATSGLVNVHEIEEALQILRQNPRVKNVNARLLPGKVRGESVLRVVVSEDKPYSLVLQLDNQESPSVGSERGLVSFTHLNLFGSGDTFSVTGRITEGLRGVNSSYTFPLNAWGTTIEAHVDLAESDVVEEPFVELDIESRSETYGFTFTQPTHRSLRSRFDLFLTGEWRRSQSFLLGSGFPFSEGLSEEGVARVTVIRLGQTWTYQGLNQVFAIRNTFSIGLDLLGATVNGGDVPDGQFLAWLGQFQWAYRLPSWLLGGNLILRADAQLAESALLGLEKLAVGGYATVRGYHENELVRDNGLIGSLELRIPVLTRGDGSPVFELAPFADIGRSWDKNRPSGEGKTIESAGVGIRWRIIHRVLAQAYWGHSFNDIDRLGESNLQDDGIHVQISAQFP